MSSRKLLWIAFRAAAGACSLFVSLHGVWNIYGLDFRVDTFPSVLYCLLPFLSFFVFLFAKGSREVVLHALIALGYLAVYSVLSWRSCTAYGYCTTVAATIGVTLRTRPILAAFGVVVLSAIGLRLDLRARSRTGSGLKD